MSDPAWLAQLRRASFRGVEFKYSDTRERGGRRLAVHEYPNNDLADVEDLGMQLRRHQVECWVIGGEYYNQRDQLRQALRKAGPGELVHPTLGVMTVSVEDWDMEESTEEMGMARFSVSFWETGALQLPVPALVTPALVTAQVAIVRSLQAPMLAKKLNVLRSYDAAEAFAQVSALMRPLGQLSAEVQAKINNPLALIGAVQGLLDPITDFGGLRSFFGVSTSATANSLASQLNRDALTIAVRLEAIVTGCGISAITAYTSANEALAARDELLEALDGVEGDVDDAMLAAVVELRSALVLDIMTRAANLAVITQQTLPASVPALVLAHRLYGPAGAAEAADDIVARNRVLHPGFLPSGVELEVLSSWA